MKLDDLRETADCNRATETLARVGDKWSVLVFMQLEDETVRFGELRRRISGISPKMLASTLRGLEREGFVVRTVHPTKPPSVDYALTALGREMATPIRAVGTWVLDNIHRIEDARRRFDTEHAASKAPVR
ncbi:helix-turn-helix domain-containing protein [Arthrobacter sp. Soc17.1.1.1]|uniref:winged helix-turn-helix transcriptional regulator n=1 Tax=Arthrobacter sp. Soc17.1.1.1 TaxID=3121277 RepID=UPI002FE4F5F7